MSTAVGILVKLFIGYELPPDVKLRLTHSKEWKQMKIISGDKRPLVEIPHQGKEYLGFYLPDDAIDLTTLRVQQTRLLELLSSVLPDIIFDSGKMCLFTQAQVR